MTEKAYVPNVRRRLDNARKILLIGEWCIKIADGADGIEEAEKVHSHPLPAECGLEALHVMLMLLCGLESSNSHFVFLVRPVQERDQLFVPLG